MKKLKGIVPISFILCLICRISLCTAQTKTDTSYFVIKDRVFFSSDSLTYEGMMLEFCVYRNYSSGNIIQDVNIFGNETYKIKNAEWFVKDNKKWQLCFSKRSFIKREKVFLNKKTLILLPINEVIFEGQPCLKYKITLSGYPEETNDYMIFSVSDGIIALLYDKITLKRTKIRPNPFMNCK